MSYPYYVHRTANEQSASDRQHDNTLLIPNSICTNQRAASSRLPRRRRPCQLFKIGALFCGCVGTGSFVLFFIGCFFVVCGWELEKTLTNFRVIVNVWYYLKILITILCTAILVIACSCAPLLSFYNYVCMYVFIVTISSKTQFHWLLPFGELRVALNFFFRFNGMRRFRASLCEPFV